MRRIGSPPADQTGLRRRWVRKVISELSAFMMLMSGFSCCSAVNKGAVHPPPRGGVAQLRWSFEKAVGLGRCQASIQRGSEMPFERVDPKPRGSDVISVGRLVREQNVGLLEATTYARGGSTLSTMR